MIMLMQPESGQYDFIMNTDHKPKKPLVPSGNSKQSRIIIVVVAAFVLIIAVIVVFSLISSAGNAGKDELIKAAQQQSEILRISKLGTDRARGTSAKNLATTTSLSLQSDQTTLLASLKSHGIKLSSKDLALGKNAKTDTILTTAEQSNKFDEVFTQTIQAELVTYQKTLKAAYDKADSNKLKQTLSDEFNHASLLATAKQ